MKFIKLERVVILNIKNYKEIKTITAEEFLKII